MIQSVWLVEFRHRDRKNGKWSEWQSINAEFRNPYAYINSPAIVMGDKYQTRAVEYIRKEPVE